MGSLRSFSNIPKEITTMSLYHIQPENREEFSEKLRENGIVATWRENAIVANEDNKHKIFAILMDMGYFKGIEEFMPVYNHDLQDDSELPLVDQYLFRICLTNLCMKALASRNTEKMKKTIGENLMTILKYFK